MATISYIDGKMTCGTCNNDDITKFRPERAKSGTSNPLMGINMRCTVCDTLHDMSESGNQKPV